MFIKAIVFLYQRFIEPTADFAADLGRLDQGNFDKIQLFNPVFYFSFVILIVVLLLICLLSIFTYSYYWILLAVYQTKILDPTEEQIQWCEEKNLKYYNFCPFYEKNLLIFNDNTKHFIGFQTKSEALFFKMNREL